MLAWIIYGRATEKRTAPVAANGSAGLGRVDFLEQPRCLFFLIALLVFSYVFLDLIDLAGSDFQTLFNQQLFHDFFHGLSHLFGLLRRDHEERNALFI
jgi:hypothetical protein